MIAKGTNAPEATYSPSGWHEERVRRVLSPYEEQTEDGAVVEDEAAFESRDQTTMEIPNELHPKSES